MTAIGHFSNGVLFAPPLHGNTVIDARLATQAPGSFNAVQRLCYIGTRGMGALEFEPVIGGSPDKGRSLEVDRLVKLASEILTHRNQLETTFAGRDQEAAVRDILRVGSSASGARARTRCAYSTGNRFSMAASSSVLPVE